MATIVGTMGYAAPEQWLGRPEPSSDLYSLAATLYHLVTGKEPDPRGRTADEVDRLLQDRSNPVSAKDRWFYELLKINLSEDVNDRYFSAAEFKADLEQHQVRREIQCRLCQTTNPVRKPFCVRCAAPLTEAKDSCNECGKNLPLGIRFCIYCGNRLR